MLFGGTGSESFNLNMPDFYPDRLESGTLSYPAVVSLGEGALYLEKNLARHGEKTLELTRALYEGLSKIAGVRLFSKPNPYGIIALSLESMQSELAAFRLSDEYGICVRGGLHCAPLMHKALESDGLIRVSVSPFNMLSECDAFLRAITVLAK